MAPAESSPALSPSPVAAPRANLLVGILRRFGWLIVVAVIGIGGAIFAAHRDSSGNITQGGSLQISSLQVGDCFNPKDIHATQAEEVDAKRCDETHQFEMMAIAAMPAGRYPTEADFESFVQATCVPAFADYVGIAYDASKLDVYWYFPLQDGWDAGDRTIQCAVYDPLDSSLVGSLRGAAR